MRVRARVIRSAAETGRENTFTAACIAVSVSSNFHLLARRLSTIISTARARKNRNCAISLLR